jgi:flagellin
MLIHSSNNFVSIKGIKMAAVLGTNVASLWASKNLQTAQTDMATSVERLSSGLRINRARDDAAGLAVANALTQQINSADMGIRNLNDGISIAQTAEAAISTASEMAQRILALSIQAQGQTLSDAQRGSIQSEMDNLITAIDNITTRTKFSGTSLLAGTAVVIYSGSTSTESITVSAGALASISKGVGALTLSQHITSAATVATRTVATFQSIATAATAYITALDSQRALLGGSQNQIEYSVTNLMELSSNLAQARSRIIDTDYASETATLTKGQILQQAATAMLAQANQMPNVILSLLK